MELRECRAWEAADESRWEPLWQAVVLAERTLDVEEDRPGLEPQTDPVLMLLLRSQELRASDVEQRRRMPGPLGLRWLAGSVWPSMALAAELVLLVAGA